jgi:molybdate transport repressor ModE-like protein
MLRVHIRPHWEISFQGERPNDTAGLITLLLAVQESGSIAQGARAAGFSYRYAWGMLRDAEQLFGAPLITSGRGRGTTLTPLAQKLAWADRRVAARLQPTLESLASELESELGKMTAERLQLVRLFASHGFAVAALMDGLNKDRLPVELSYRNSTDAVAALARGECDLAGFPVPVGKFGPTVAAWYQRWLDPAKHCLVHVAQRAQGLFVAPGNPLGITALRDIVRSDVRFVNRQVGSGTRQLLELMLADERIAAQDISGINSAEYTHSAVAAYIASGMADVGLGVQTAAEQFRLGFVPLVRERYFFALHTDALHDPLLRQLIEILQSAPYRERVGSLPGYDATDTGRILTLAEAFSA